MKSVKFNLEIRKNKEGKVIDKNVPIRLSFHFNGERLEYYTGIRVSSTKNFNSNYWKLGKPVIKANEPEAARKNQLLRDLKRQTELIYDQSIALGKKPSSQSLKSELDRQFKQKTSSEKKMLVKDAFEEFLRYIQNRNKETTLRKHTTTLKHLSSIFGKEWLKMSFDNIESDFAEKFKAGLIRQGYKEQHKQKEYLHNTVVKYLNSLRDFFNWCKDIKRGYFSGTIEFGYAEKEINVIYLTFEEIEKLRTAEMPSKKLEEVRDVFLFCCYTGLRYSDLFKLKKSDVLGNEIRFYITKGSNTTWQYVPLVEKSKAILDKYQSNSNVKALPVFSNQKMNDYIKEVSKIAGINEVMEIREVKGNGSIVDQEYQKWQLISCHTARKSFISFAIENGMEEQVIKSITGHSKNSRAFTRYFQISNTKKQSAMIKLFSGSESMLKAV